MEQALRLQPGYLPGWLWRGNWLLDDDHLWAAEGVFVRVLGDERYMAHGGAQDTANVGNSRRRGLAESSIAVAAQVGLARIRLRERRGFMGRKLRQRCSSRWSPASGTRRRRGFLLRRTACLGERRTRSAMPRWDEKPHRSVGATSGGRRSRTMFAATAARWRKGSRASPKGGRGQRSIFLNRCSKTIRRMQCCSTIWPRPTA